MVAVLLDAGADIDAQDNNGDTPLILCMSHCCAAPARLLLERGASVDIAAADGTTPLIAACADRSWFSDDDGRWAVFQEILSRSSTATRCAVFVSDGGSAVDDLGYSLRLDKAPFDEDTLRVRERRRWAIAELLRSGAPVLPRFVRTVLPIAVALSAEQHAELAARRSERRRWRAHLTFVDWSLD